MMKFFLIGTVVLAIVAVAGGAAIYFLQQQEDNKGIEPQNIQSFEDCVAAGNAVMESYPRQCRSEDGRTFVEDIGNELEKHDLIRVSNPRPNQVISSPLHIEGEARGYWFYEADFPIRLFDEKGNEIAIAIAKAQSDWMTEDFVPFEADLEFIITEDRTGTLIFERDNASDLPENDDQLEMPVQLQAVQGIKEGDTPEGILTVKDLEKFVDSGVTLQFQSVDLKAQLNPNHPEQKNLDSFYLMEFSENGGRNISLNVIDLASSTLASLWYDRVQKEIPGSAESILVGDVGLKKQADKAESLGNLVLVQRDDKVFQLHTFEPSDTDVPLVSLDELVEIAKLVEQNI